MGILSQVMNTISAILMPSSDGTLHLPLPAAWRHQSIRVKAELEPVTQEAVPKRAKAGLWKDMPGEYWMAADFNAPLEDFREYME